MGVCDPHLVGWLRLARCRGLGLRDALNYAQRAGGADFLADPEETYLRRVGIPEKHRAALLDGKLAWSIRREIRRVRRLGWRQIHLDHPHYPERLTEIYDPPPVLTCRGDTRLLLEPTIAFVGTRRPTRYGLTMTGRLVAPLAARGLAIASGLARGIDGEAHRAALEAGGVTLAVMATGPDTIYPGSHRKLAERIAEQGLLITELAPGVGPRRTIFPKRNRIIVGLSHAVVVVEASLRSGSMVTARIAGDENRDLIAVPGRVGEPGATACLELIRDGAAMATRPEDILAELRPEVLARLTEMPDDDPLASGKPPLPGGLDLDCRRVLTLFPQHDPLELDEILHQAEGKVDDVLTALFSLELAGVIENLPGNRYARARPNR